MAPLSRAVLSAAQAAIQVAIAQSNLSEARGALIMGGFVISSDAGKAG